MADFPCWGIWSLCPPLYAGFSSPPPRNSRRRIIPIRFSNGVVKLCRRLVKARFTWGVGFSHSCDSICANAASAWWGDPYEKPSFLGSMLVFGDVNCFLFCLFPPLFWSSTTKGSKPFGPVAEPCGFSGWWGTTPTILTILLMEEIRETTTVWMYKTL